jgi:hypothetical protein
MGILLTKKNAYNENFLTTFVYIPPQNNQIQNYYQNKIVDNIHSQTDLIPTIFSLLNNQSYANSFAFDLNKNFSKDNYESCHVLTQPYGGAQIAVVKELDKYIYSLAEKNVTYFNLKEDWFEHTPIIIETNMNLNDFKTKYYCERYKLEVNE